MPEFIFSIIFSLVFGTVFFEVFPIFHTMLSSVDSSGLPYLVRVMVTLLPYVLVFAVVYGFTLIWKSKRNG